MSPELPRTLEEVKAIINNDPLWYTNPVVASLLDTYFSKESEKQEHNDGWRNARHEVITVFADVLKNNQIKLGNAPEYFNDDDRWDSMNWDYEQNHGISFLTHEVNSKVQKDHPDTIVIHHSNTANDVDMWEMEALGLLRIYVPNYRTKVFNTLGEYAPVSSGHYRIIDEGKYIQTFIPYHYLVFADGRVVNVLEDKHTGLQSGDYITNCRSVAICFIGDCSSELPSDEAIAVVRSLLVHYNTMVVIGHRDVVHGDRPVETKCPGDTWDELKNKLLALVT